MAIETPSVTAADRHELVRLRRELHQHPEPAFEETWTAEKMAGALVDQGMEVRTGVGKTGVVGTMALGGPGRCVMLRADMDALQIQEGAPERPYRSRRDGLMHACGHDGHMATLLVALRILARERGELAGTVKAIFQPAEEVGGGAKRMFAEGVLSDPDVDAAFGLHYWTYEPTGVIGVKAGPTMASVDEFAVTVRGQGGHAAMPHQTADALVAAAYLVTELQTVVSRWTDPQQPAVVTVGELHAGSAFNIIPAEAELSGTVRTFDPELAEAIPGRIEEVIAGVCETHGCAYELTYDRHNTPLVNDDEQADLVREVATELVGSHNLVEVSTMGGEDMGEYLAAVPGCFFFVGARNEDEGIVAPHHHPDFDLDEEALAIGAEMLVRVVRRYLR